MTEGTGGDGSPERAEHTQTLLRRIDNFEKQLDRGSFAKKPFKEIPFPPPSVGLLPDFLNDLERVGFSDYDSTEFMKILFDSLSRYSEISLGIARSYLQNTEDKQDADLPENANLPEYSDMLGHELVHTSEVYANRNKKPIPDDERDVHAYGAALINLCKIRQGTNLHEAEAYFAATGKIELESEIQRIRQQYQSQKLPHEEYYRLTAKVWIDFFENFAHPFLSREETERIVKELVDKLKKPL